PPRHRPCGEEGTGLCGRCAALLEAPPRPVDSSCDALQVLTAARVRAQHRDGRLLPAGVDHSPLLPVLALGEYGGDLQRLVLAWKNRGMLPLGARPAQAVVPAVTPLAAGGGVPGPALLPVPCRASLARGRGTCCCCAPGPQPPRTGRAPGSGGPGASGSRAAGPAPPGGARSPWSSSTTWSPPGPPCAGCTRRSPPPAWRSSV